MRKKEDDLNEEFYFDQGLINKTAEIFADSTIKQVAVRGPGL